MKELWKPVTVQGYFNYEVSNLGRVYSKKSDKVLSPRKGSKGYMTVNLSYLNTQSSFRVHRLVALAFIPNPSNYPLVNHKDCNKQNNRIDNLEWCTNDMNIAHAVINKRYNKIEGSKVATSKLVEKEVIEIRALFKAGHTRRQLAEMYHTKPSNIKDIVLRRSWKHI